MFRKKDAPRAPFSLQVLTTDYLIEGTVDGDTDLYFPEAETQDPIFLTSVHIQTLRAGDRPPHWAARFALWGSSAVVLIPEGDVVQKIVDELWDMYDTPRPGLFYVGPYLMQGRLMLLSREYMEETLPMFDVTITCELPGVEWAGVNAPFGLVNTRWLHGYEPA